VSRNTKLSIALFGLALVLRLITLMFVLPKLRPDLDLDSYHSLANSLAAGKGFVAVAPNGHELPNVARTPVYPLFLAGLVRVGGDRVGVFLAMQCVLGALTCALTVLLAARWLRPQVSILAGLLVAIDPNSILRCAQPGRLSNVAAGSTLVSAARQTIRVGPRIAAVFQREK